MSDTAPPEVEAPPSIEDTDPEQAAIELDATAHELAALDLGDQGIDDDLPPDGDETVADMHVLQFDPDGVLRDLGNQGD